MANDLLDAAINDFSQDNLATKSPAGAPGAVGSVLDEAIDSVAARSKARDYASALNGLAADPDKYKEYMDLGAKTGFDPAFVGRNYDALKRGVMLDDVTSLLKYNPALGEWYAEGDNSASIKVDELRHLSGLSWLTSAASTSFGEGLRTTQLADLRYRQMMGRATGADEDQIAAIGKLAQDRTYGADSWFERGYVGAAQQIPIMGETMWGGVKGAIVGGAAAGATVAVAGQLGPQVMLPEEIITVPAAVTIGGRVGYVYGGYEASFKQQAGLAYDEFIQYKDENGKTLDPDTARVAALVTGALNGGLELVGFHALSKIIPGVDKLTGGVTADVVKQALTRPAVRAAFQEFGKNIASSVSTETATEVAQEAVTMFGGVLAKEYSDQPFAPMTAADAADRLGQTFQQTVETMLVMGPVLSGTRLGSDISAARRATQSQAVIDAVINHAQNDELIKRLPEKAAEAVRAMTANGEVSSVFVSPEVIRQFFQDPQDLANFTATIGIDHEFNEASAINRDVEIPIDTYYTAIAGTPFGDATRRDFKFSPDDMSSNAADAFNEAWTEAQKTLSEEFKARSDSEAKAMTSSEAVFDDVKAKALDAGMTPEMAGKFGQLYSSFFTTLATRTGQDPADLFFKYGFDIRRALPGQSPYREADGLSAALEMIKRGRVPAVRKRLEQARGTSMLARIQQRGGVVDTGGELAAMNAGNIIRDGVTGMGDMLDAGNVDNSFSPDDTLRQLWEEGYFPEFQDRPEVNALYDAISSELGGEPRYSVQQDQTNTTEMRRASELVQFADMLDELGLDPSKMSEDDIREELDRLSNADPDTGALYQKTIEALNDEGVRTFMQEAYDGPDETKRGSIQFSEGRTIINLFEASNLSTFLHESGHFFLEAFRDAAKSEAPIATDRAGGEYLLKGQPLPETGLAPANLGDDGSVYVGAPGGVHFMIEAPKGVSFADTGFITPAGEYLNRQEALAWTEADGAPVKPSENMGNGLDALDYKEQAKPSGKQQSPGTQLQRDWQAVKEYLGVTDDMNIGRDSHEKFARTFEAYLFEGKAPSNEVAGIMATFRSWLTFVYKKISNLNVPINDKIRGVMDRLIATDEEIKAASFSPDFQPAFSSAEEVGMTEKQYADYVATAGRAVEEAKKTMTVAMLDDVARQTKKEWRDARREIRDEVQQQHETMPIYQAISYLKTGKSDLVPYAMHLDKDATQKVLADEGALYLLPKSVPPIYRVKGGVHPDVIAELFGFSSGHEMLKRMISVPPIARAINEETNRRMRERFGDLMGDAAARVREARNAITNDETGKLLETELEVLAKKSLATSKISKDNARRIASSTIRGKTIREAVRTRLYQNAAFKAAGEAQDAIRKQDWREAFAAKQRQLLSHYMAQESLDVTKEVTSAANYLNRFTGRKRPGTVAPEYLDQIEQLLEKFDLRKSITLKDAQKRTSLAAWIEQQEANGNMVVLPDTVRNDAFRKPYKQMNVDDFLTVRDAVKNIEHLGRLKAELLANKERREFIGSRDELIAAVGASKDYLPTPKTRNPTDMDKLWSFGKSLEAMLIKMEQAFDWMDGGDPNGPFNRYIWRPIAAAQARESEMQAEYAGKVFKVFEKLDKDRMNERLTISGLDKTYLRSEVMAVALNMGSESNLDKMLRGEGWSKQPAILDTIVSHLNDAEWNAVQEIWDTINELWPDIKALQKRLSGVEPPKVEAREFETATGKKMRGGYYPMMYDPKQVDAATAEGRAIIRAAAETDRRIAANDKVQFENVYTRPETRHGFTNERVQQFAMPVLFDLDGLGRHLNAVIHDVTHREAIMDANKLLTDPFVRGEIEARYGRELYEQVVPWLQNIAHDAYKKDGLGAAERAYRGLRSRATIVAMGFRISTMLSQLAGFTPSIEVLIPSGSKGGEGFIKATKAMAGAMKDFTTNPRETWEMVHAKSPEIRDRVGTLDRDIKDKIRELTGKTDFLSRAQKFSMYGIGYMDRVVSAPTWLAAYRLHLSANPTDEMGARAAGDRAVRLSQGSGGAKDLAAVQRNSELTKLVTMFYSYFSAYYNRQRTWGADAKRAIKAGEVREFPDLLARQVMMTIAPAILGELLVGRGPDGGDDDKGESFFGWAIKKSILYPFSAVPVLRDVVSAGDNLLSKKPYGGDYRLSPIERTVNDATLKPLELIGQIVDEDKDVDPRKATRTIINAAGLWFGLPTGQLSTTVNNVWLGIEQDDFRMQDLVLSRPEKREK